jgi:hypothetical protein
MLLTCAAVGCLLTISILGYPVLSIVFGIVAVVGFGYCAYDEHFRSHRGFGGSFKRTDKMAKR